MAAQKDQAQAIRPCACGFYHEAKHNKGLLEAAGLRNGSAPRKTVLPLSGQGRLFHYS